ncbi:MAG TPA: hypothetical protein VMZ91_00895 [Candidatus Paceibacterota bacterium]|nr:hypothetical protein [Candidatus Paceibacterota bacterium]
MIDKSQLYLLTQLVKGMEESCIKLEGDYQYKNAEQFEQAKKSMVDFQKKLSRELEKTKRDEKNE